MTNNTDQTQAKAEYLKYQGAFLDLVNLKIPYWERREKTITFMQSPYIKGLLRQNGIKPDNAAAFLCRFFYYDPKKLENDSLGTFWDLQTYAQQ